MSDGNTFADQPAVGTRPEPPAVEAGKATDVDGGVVDIGDAVVVGPGIGIAGPSANGDGSVILRLDTDGDGVVDATALAVDTGAGVFKIQSLAPVLTPGDSELVEADPVIVVGSEDVVFDDPASKVAPGPATDVDGGTIEVGDVVDPTSAGIAVTLIAGDKTGLRLDTDGDGIADLEAVAIKNADGQLEIIELIDLPGVDDAPPPFVDPNPIGPGRDVDGGEIEPGDLIRNGIGVQELNQDGEGQSGFLLDLDGDGLADATALAQDVGGGLFKVIRVDPNDFGGKPPRIGNPDLAPVAAPIDDAVPPGQIEVPEIQDPVLEDEPALAEEPVDDQPELDQPALDEPVLVDEPALDEPALDEPAVDAPALEEPVLDEPVVDVRGVQSPAEVLATNVVAVNPLGLAEQLGLVASPADEAGAPPPEATPFAAVPDVADARPGSDAGAPASALVEAVATPDPASELPSALVEAPGDDLELPPGLFGSAPAFAAGAVATDDGPDLEPARTPFGGSIETAIGTTGTRDAAIAPVLSPEETAVQPDLSLTEPDEDAPDLIERVAAAIGDLFDDAVDEIKDLVD